MAEAANTPIGGQGVALGREGTGQAQVLGQTVSPLQLYISERDKNQARVDADAKARKLARDKDISDTMEFDPGETWTAAYDNVEDYTQKNVRDWATDRFNEGYGLNDISKELGRRQSEARKMAKKYKYFENIHTDFTKQIDGDKYIQDKSYYKSKANDRFFEDDDIKVKQTKDIDINGIGDITDDSSGYNKDLIAADFMQQIPQQIVEDFKRKAGTLGIEFDEAEYKSKLFLRNPDNSVMTDKHNNPLVGITPEVYNVAMQNRYISNTVNDAVGADASTEEKTQFLKEWFTPFDKASERHQTKRGFKYDKDDLHASGLARKDQPRTATRFNTLYNAIYGYDQAGLNNAFPGLKGKGATVKFDQNVKAGGPMTAGDIKPTAIVVDFNKKEDQDQFASDLGTGGGAFDQDEESGTIRIPIMSEDEKMAALHALNKLIDDGQSQTGHRVGADNMAMYINYLRATDQFGSSGGVYGTGNPNSKVEGESNTGGVY